MTKKSHVLILIFLTSLLLNNNACFAQEKKPEDGSAKVSGDAALLTQWIDHGLMQTNGDPCIQTSLWFGFGPQFKMGFIGSNYSNTAHSDSHVLLRLAADIKIPLGGNAASLTIFYRDNHYFKPGTLDGNNSGIKIDVLGYIFTYEQLSNWEGSEMMTTYYSLEKVFDVSGLKWSNQLGYSMLTDTGYADYFDLRSGIGIKSGFALYEAALTATSSNQLKSRGGPNLVLSAKMSF